MESTEQNQSENELQSNEESTIKISDSEGVKLSEEEIKIKIAEMELIKVEANEQYKSKNYLEALNSYIRSIKQVLKEYSDDMPTHYISSINDSIDKEFHSLISTLFLNRGLCFKQLREFDNAIDNFSKSLLFNQENHKAQYQRLELNYNKGEYLEAQEDYIKLKQADSKLLSEFITSEYILNLKAEEKKKELTGEMMGKLKDVGNSLLGMFGMSLDNFQLNQNNGGGYNIQYKN